MGLLPGGLTKGDLNIQQLVSQPETVQALQSHRTRRTKFWLSHSKEAQLATCLITCLQKMISLPCKSQAKTDLAHPKMIDVHMKLSHTTLSVNLVIIKHSQTLEYSKLNNILDNDGCLTV